MSEAQLIGRGARYCPFQVSPEQSYYMRKYDDDITNELRICEELYYHSAYNPRYIQELNTALQEIGIKPKEAIERDVKIKKDFKDTVLYKTGLLFLNERKKYNREDICGLQSGIIDEVHRISLKTGRTKASVMFETPGSMPIELKEKNYILIDFGESVVRKAIDRLEFYQFSNLKKYLPNLKSISEFIESEKYIANIKIEVSGLSEQINDLSQDHKLEVATEVLENISHIIASDKIEFKGTKEFKPCLLKDKIKDKTLNFALNEDIDKECGKSMNNALETAIHLDLSKRNWYIFNDCFGTSEEKYLIKYIDKTYEKLKTKYDKVYLVRNERYFKLYNFEDGRALEPDFVLFLVKKKSSESMYYQIFIEPKGSHLLEQDKWKEDFLKTVNQMHRLEQLWKGRKYVIWGMPFYNENLRKRNFDEIFVKNFNDSKEIVKNKKI